MASENHKKKRIGRYEILDEIGRGGMAIVYRAIDTSLKREVALKLLHPHLASHSESRKRFRREAHAVARLHHISIVEVYDYSDEDGEEVYIVMELVDGTTLRKFLSDCGESPLAAEAAALIARQIFFALSKAHEEGVVHRDVKPENILIGTDGIIRLSDFGIAHLVGLDQMTVTGQILGSPAYMSPEHIEMAELDARADIFSVGTMLYEMAVGSLPFQGNNPHQIIKRIIEGYYDHPLVVKPAVGHHVAAVIVRCMQQDSSQRYQSASEAVADLDAALNAVGATSIEEELADFFGDPGGWTDRNRVRVVQRTLALGQEARKAGRLPEAMDHFNRVLSMEPGNERALDAVAGLSRRRRLRRGLERVAIALALLVVIGVVVWMVVTGEEGPVEKDDPVIGPVAERDTGGLKKGPPDGGESSTAVVPEDTDRAPRNERDAGESGDVVSVKHPTPLVRPVLHPKARREVIFKPNPMRVEIEIDGKERFVFKTTDRTRKLSLGKHVVRFIPEDERRLVLTQTIDVVAGETPMGVGARLKWRPARLKVNSNVDTVVVVQGRSPGKTNRFFEVPMEVSEEKVKAVVSAKGYRAATKQVTISAGETVEVTVDLIEQGLPAAP